MKRIYRYDEPDFAAEVERICARGVDDTAQVEPAVRAILDRVAAEGDAALIALTEQFDRIRPVIPPHDPGDPCRGYSRPRILVP